MIMAVLTDELCLYWNVIVDIQAVSELALSLASNNVYKTLHKR